MRNAVVMRVPDILSLVLLVLLIKESGIRLSFTGFGTSFMCIWIVASALFGII